MPDELTGGDALDSAASAACHEAKALEAAEQAREHLLRARELMGKPTDAAEDDSRIELTFDRLRGWWRRDSMRRRHHRGLMPRRPRLPPRRDCGRRQRKKARRALSGSSGSRGEPHRGDDPDGDAEPAEGRQHLEPHLSAAAFVVLAHCRLELTHSGRRWRLDDAQNGCCVKVSALADRAKAIAKARPLSAGAHDRLIARSTRCVQRFARIGYRPSAHGHVIEQVAHVALSSINSHVSADADRPVP